MPSPTISPIPVEVPGITTAVGVTVGNGFSCALLADGTTQCWGQNNNGQLGNGTTTSTTGPGFVVELDEVSSLSAGDRHACAVVDTTVRKCWGAGESGQQGNGNAQHTTPLRVVTQDPAVSITAGSVNTCSIRPDDSVQCWGDNEWGQVGDGTTGGQWNVPTNVIGITSAVDLSIGRQHVCAVLADGGAQCWGTGHDGQLGRNMSGPWSEPLAVAGITNATSVPAGGDSTCILLADGTVMCTGWNTHGQLGAGILSSLETQPAQVMTVQ